MNTNLSPLYRAAGAASSSMLHSTAHSARSTSKTSADGLRPEPTGVLQASILAALNKVLQKGQAKSVESSVGQDFSPQAVADRILGFIDRGLSAAQANGASDEKLSALREQAKQGVEKGFKEARDILQGLGVLNGSIKTNVDDTYQRIQDGFAQREQALLSQDPQTAATQNDTAADSLITRPSTGSNVARLQSQSVSASEGEQFALQITTQEGDVITLQLQHATSYSASSSVISDDQGTTSVSSSNYSESHQYLYSVQGNLNADEKKALDSLLNNVGHLSDQFFAGHMQQAIGEASQLQLDASQFSSLHLDLQHSTSVSAAVQYQQVAALTPGDASTNGAATNDAQPAAPTLSELLKDLRDLLASAQKSFGHDAGNWLHDLLGKAFNTDARALDNTPRATTKLLARVKSESTLQ